MHWIEWAELNVGLSLNTIAHFADESLQSIDCTGNYNQTWDNQQNTPTAQKKQNQNKLVLQGVSEKNLSRNSWR